MKQRTYHLRAMTAVHVGTGQGEGAIDLPVMRSRSTRLPLIPGSAIKGVMRTDFSLADGVMPSTVFGPEKADDDSLHAGALAVGDAHLLALPIRAVVGLVAYATCPFVLRRYQRDVGATWSVPELPNEHAAVTSSTVLKHSDGKVYLEDLDFSTANAWAAEVSDIARDIAARIYPDDADAAWRNEFVEHFLILPDSAFGFMAEHATEVRARVKINRDKRTVQEGMLWYEENLPMDSVLWGVMGISKARDSSGHSADNVSAGIPPGSTLLQIGGKHTVGRGLCYLIMGEG